MSSWFDRFNKVWASAGLRDDPTDAQANAGWAYIGQAPPTVEQFNATFQWWDNKDNWLYNQIAQVILSAGMTPSETDLTQLLKAIRAQQRYRLSAPLTLFVDSVNGNDNNTGAAGSPFKTIGRAVYYVLYQIDQGGQQVTLQLAPGTYDPLWIVAPQSGTIAVNGDVLNPRGYLIKNTNGAAVTAASGVRMHFQGLSFEANGVDIDYATTGTGIVCTSGSAVSFMDVAFGPCSAHHTWSSAAGYITIADTGLSYSIYGGTTLGAHMFASSGGVSNCARAHVTIQNNPRFNNGFACAAECGCVQAWNCIFTGTATGPRYVVSMTSSINVNGAGINFLPGDAAGWADPATFGAYG